MGQRVERNLLGLTPRQMAVARAVAEGATNVTAAGHLGLSRTSVETVLGEIYSELGLSGRSARQTLGVVLRLYDAGKSRAARRLCPMFAEIA